VTKQKKLQNQSEVIEPHDIAGIMTDEQLEELASALLELVKKKNKS
jgi:hypothetical protein